MLRIGRLKLAYALASLLWVAYSYSRLLTPHIAGHIPIAMGTVFCMLLFVSIPAFGYVLLFRLFPTAGRFLRR